LLQRVDAGDFKVNKIDAVVIPKSDYIIQGNDFKAEIFLAASDTTQVPKIYIGEYQSFKNDQGDMDFKMVGNYRELPVVGGRGILSEKTGRTGIIKWGGLLEVTAPDGSKQRKPFRHEYEVAQPNVVVSPSKMNVFYRGVDNPVEVSIPGISKDKISITVDGDSKFTRTAEGFNIVPGRATICNVTVTADIDGTKRNMGTRPFRIRDVPDPIAAVRGVAGRIVDKNELAASLALEARMPAGFDFDLTFRITSFTVMATVGGFTRNATSTSQVITDEQRRLFDGLRSGQSVNIVDIKAVGPDGRPRDLYDIVYRIR